MTKSKLLLVPFFIIIVVLVGVFVLETNIEIGFKPMLQSCEDLWLEQNEIFEKHKANPTMPWKERQAGQERFIEVTDILHTKCGDWMMNLEGVK